MRINQLGQSDLHISELSLGCMSLGTNQKHAEGIIHEAIDLGINYLDTADLYNQGVNEEIIGKAIKSKRDDVILATKVGNHLKDDGSWFWDPSKAYIKDQVKASLQRLQTDYIDLYQLHGGTMEDPIDETIGAFEDLVQEGVIRYYGISSIRPNVIREYVKKSNIISVMSQYSILDRRPEEEILPLLEENNISVVTRGSLAKGMLSNKASQLVEQKGQDGFLDYNESELKSTVKELQNILEPNQTLNGLALHYVLQSKTVASSVTGASSIEQLKTNVKALEETFSDDQLEKVRSIAKQNVYQNHR
ncbi:aldo/keto reductase [Gracilibacillus sp. YIM 98692]|uniref:aldo/keto reductase n=1 Tax=Gracilibacillus sp. YIM 98692 TaxID=2663532 RepID=UPI0013D011C4|nr:aldo/keto reductase [Gracilibacillus sp. YIM 98692]